MVWRCSKKIEFLTYSKSLDWTTRCILTDLNHKKLVKILFFVLKHSLLCTLARIYSMLTTDKYRYDQTFRILAFFLIRLFAVFILFSGLNYTVTASGGIEEPNPSLSKLQPDPQLQHWILETSQNILGKQMISDTQLEKLESMRVQAPAMYKYHATNHKLYHDMASAGHPDVMALLAANFHFGRGVNVNPVKALRWFLESAEKDNLQSQLAASLYLLTGKAFQKDLSESEYWLKKAHLQGSVLAKKILHRMDKITKLESSNSKNISTLSRKINQNLHNAEKSSQRRPKLKESQSTNKYQNAGSASIRKFEIAKKLLELNPTPERSEKIKRNLVDSLNLGNLEAGLLLVQELLSGDILQKDSTVALKILNDLANRNNPQALALLGDFYFRGDGVKRDVKKAIQFYERAAEQNLPEVHLKLGLIELESMADTKGDRSKGLSYLKAAADKGSLEAQKIYAEEMLREQKYTIAAKYFEESANQGDIDSMVSLAELGAQQSNITHKIDSVYWYIQAALKGHYEAQYESGMLYVNGKNVPRDFRLAYRWLLLAAQKGHKNAQFQLGVLYSRGLGVPVNDYRAAKWYLKAAKQSHRDAAAILGTLYYDGKGVTQDFNQALYWFTKAAQQGDSQIQELLVKLYRGEMQISPNYVKAYAWANVLAESHESHRQNADNLQTKLSMDELKNAQELSLNHFAKIQQNRLAIN